MLRLILVLALALVPVAARAAPPVGYQIMCLRAPATCQAGSATEAATPALMARLEQTSARINRAIVPRNDTGDTWSDNPKAGDCEDYALTKRNALLRAGVKRGALRFLETKAGADYHIVLLVKTTAGQMVLDNLTDAVKPLAATGYRMIAILP